MAELESPENFKKRIMTLTIDEQIVEINRRMAQEKMDIKVTCPHCSTNTRKYDISLHKAGDMLFCLDCHASWRTSENGDHRINDNLHKGVCIK